jgi:hypothetical protein
MNNKKIKKLFNKDLKKTFNTIGRDIEKTAVQTGDVIKDTFRFNKRFDVPPILTEYLNKYGNNVIVGATLYRHKVNSLITSALNVLSNSDFDKLFHLRCYFNLDNGQEIYIEKNERLNCGTGNKQQGHDFLNVSSLDIPPNLTFGKLVEATRLLMGEKFLTYSASSNNCQYFIRAVFQANNMLRPNYEEFIKQNTESIFRNNPSLRAFSNTVTDIAGEANAIISGGELHEDLYCVCCDKIVPFKHREKHNNLQSHKSKKKQLLNSY